MHRRDSARRSFGTDEGLLGNAGDEDYDEEEEDDGSDSLLCRVGFVACLDSCRTDGADRPIDRRTDGRSA